MVNQRDIENRVNDSTDCQYVLDRISDFENSDDRTQLVSISKELFSYEKKYFPEYTGNCDVLICTVGMREAPIILSQISVKPKRSILLHTEGSEHVADKIQADPDIKKLNIEFKKIEIDDLDAAHNYNVLKNEVLPQIGNRQNVRIDPTAGRKIMGTAVGSFAFFYRIPMIYLHAEEKMGISVPFTGKICDIENPYDYYGDVDMQILKANFDNGYFDAAAEVCEQLRGKVRDLALGKKLDLLQDFIQVYCDWDRFLHSSFASSAKERKDESYLSDRLKSICADCKRYGIRLVREDDLRQNIEFLEEIENHWKPGTNIVDKFRIVDIFKNAQRRAIQGKYDDATARLYRCLEMCAALLMEKEGVCDINKIDYEKFAADHGMTKEDLFARFKEISNFDSPRSPPGLNDIMTILQVINVPSAHMYGRMNSSDENGENLRDKRNRSLLAHGTNPITREDYNVLFNGTEKIIASTLGKKQFKQLARRSDIPKLLI
ncbi:TIGR02710 family CRISPR-associated CARF protein [Methanohalophilus sp. WG1-DM]|jgi:CRISPR-associated protein (TIGR02710 family)|uniref:TIGR02710 family CRISPR-associated CARF protein n=1 Tax=Methanohalophilus sp. WG1-DM TaxID=2491675 RepID=UPI000FBF484F|nr:TIGR02710 family CRISPR-associated CARF protein [Methanohalophilus sp. WG1-DM]RSD33281.1 MAG: CRISPR-associated protein TIGR02710 family [Methanohalophilus sp.]RXG33756.1 CRISPR-associated protein TIGR02710 family [Methanohalophilus sp. WG1-DM]